LPLESNLDLKITLQWDDWRPGDQPVFVCDLDKIKKFTNWEPKVNVKEGVENLSKWVNDNRELFDWIK